MNDAKNISKTPVKILNYLSQIDKITQADEIIKGLQHPVQKYILPKYFYDKTGSELYEQITGLEAYYPYRTEKSILENIAKNVDFQHYNSIVELGSGDASKISLVLQQMDAGKLQQMTYYPADISLDAIKNAIDTLQKRFRLKEITGLAMDFNQQLSFLPKTKKRLICFFGSTIGNMDIDNRNKFLVDLSREMSPGDGLLLGIDLVKNIDTLEAAYNDAQGITAKFNLNVLNVANRMAGFNFNTEDFRHRAFYNREKRRIEMHLYAVKDLLIENHIFGNNIVLKKGESIHTENSYKFVLDDILHWARITNLHISNIMTDKGTLFALIYLTKD